MTNITRQITKLEEAIQLYQRTGYEVQMVDEFPHIEGRGSLELIDTEVDTGEDGFMNCSWFHIALFLEDQNKVLISNSKHDGIEGYDSKLRRVKFCSVHKCPTIEVYNCFIHLSQCASVHDLTKESCEN